MEMEQMMACLLAEIRFNLEKMEAKMDAHQERMDNRQEEMKAQEGSLATWRRDESQSVIQ
jgi:uncharacterized coiled-coil protein SlyX